MTQALTTEIKQSAECAVLIEFATLHIKAKTLLDALQSVRKLAGLADDNTLAPMRSILVSSFDMFTTLQVLCRDPREGETRASMALACIKDVRLESLSDGIRRALEKHIPEPAAKPLANS